MSVSKSGREPDAGSSEATGQGSGRVLGDIRHGGHVLTTALADAPELARQQESITTAPLDELEDTTPFDFLFADLAAGFPQNHLPNSDPSAVVAALKTLGGAMVEDPPPPVNPLQPENNSTIPPVYTYWGQFIDHDLTANTDRDSAISDVTRPDLAPLQPDFVTEHLRNLRQPALNLDSVYGDGPTFPGGPSTAAAGFYDGPRLKVGSAAAESNDPGSPIGGTRIPPVDDLQRDLPRVDKKAQIGDGRNDENLIIAQLHTAFLRFHNAVVDWVGENETKYHNDEDIFARAQQLVRWHYQWLVIHDYLKTVTFPGVADKILLAGNKHYSPRGGEVYMPLEFSVAATALATAWSARCTTTTATSGVRRQERTASYPMRPSSSCSCSPETARPLSAATPMRCHSTGSSSGTVWSTKAPSSPTSLPARSTPGSLRRYAT